MYQAFLHFETQFREHRVLDLEVLGNVVGADIRQYFTYLTGFPDLLGLPGTYVEEWVREIYASVWVAPDHSYIHYALADTDYRVTAQRAREVLGLTASATRIHQLCYGDLSPLDYHTVVLFHRLTSWLLASVSRLVRAPARQWAISHAQLGF